MARCIANLERTLPPHKLAKLAAKLQRDVVMPETPLRPAEQNAPQRRPHGPGDHLDSPQRDSVPEAITRDPGPTPSLPAE